MTILSISSLSYAEEINDSKKYSIGNLRLNIPLFDYEKSDSLYCLNRFNFKKALQVHATYQALGDIVLLQDKQYLKLEQKYSSCDFELKACKYTLQEIDLDRKNLYELYEDTVDINKIELKRQKIRFVVIGIGGGVGAIAVGFLIGYFVSK